MEDVVMNYYEGRDQVVIIAVTRTADKWLKDNTSTISSRMYLPTSSYLCLPFKDADELKERIKKAGFTVEETHGELD